LPRPAQAPDHDTAALKRLLGDQHNGPVPTFVSACPKLVLLAGGLVLAGCGMGGFSLEKVDVDRSLVTSSVQADTVGAAGFDVDQITIRNAVSSADVEETAGKAIAWANPDTGSRGTITEVSEAKGKGRLCRRFTGSRESFDGVAMFRGETCMVGQGLWRIESFKAL